jgi:hexosaminidase
VARLSLTSTYRPREVAAGAAGSFDLVLQAESGSLPSAFTLVVWCARQLTPSLGTSARVIERVAGHVVFEPTDPLAVASEGRWEIGGLQTQLAANHANDGPETAYLVVSSDASSHVDIGPVGIAPVGVVPSVQASGSIGTGDDTKPVPPQAIVVKPPPATPSPCPVLPMPRSVRAIGGVQQRTLHLSNVSESDPRIRVAWGAVVELAIRLGAGSLAAAGVQEGTAVLVSVVDVGQLAHRDGYRLRIEEDGVALEAATAAGLRAGLTTAAQWAHAGMPERAEIEDGPTLEFRAVHMDLARRWYEPDVVERLIDVAAWRKFSHVHLHLTDDEAWRLPVDGYPALASVGGTRGHGLPIPPVCASGPAAYGRCYTAAEIDRWVDRALSLGITLVPEVDVPGHAFAALAALPSMRDPDDKSHAVSPQGYINNVLVPGHPETEPFLGAVFTSVADLFPHSPVLHIGGDEVPDGAWSRSPIVSQYASARGLTSKLAIEADFHRTLIELIRSETGRDVAMWQDAAFAGVEPAAYAVSWTSPEAGRRLVDAGHRLVSSPGQNYYLDMATGSEWELPGASWAGHVGLDATCAFDPLAGLERASDLYGIQACIWSEHMSDLDVLDALVFPRLDAIAERGWTGRITGGPDALIERAARLPTFTR